MNTQDPNENLIEEGKKLMLDFDKILKISQTNAKVVPVVVQDIESKEILIIAYANKTALEYTLKYKTAAFWSTSRNELWVKGKESGNFLPLVEVRVNCEQNSLLYIVRLAKKGSCHTRNQAQEHRQTCFYRKVLSIENIQIRPGME